LREWSECVDDALHPFQFPDRFTITPDRGAFGDINRAFHPHRFAGQAIGFPFISRDVSRDRVATHFSELVSQCDNFLLHIALTHVVLSGNIFAICGRALNAGGPRKGFRQKYDVASAESRSALQAIPNTGPFVA
jgi:hypothetical protein